MTRAPRASLVTGLALGGVVATGLSAWVTGVRLFSGTAPFERLGTTYPAVVGLYYTGGLLGGMLVGLAWPLRRWFLGSVFLGVLGVFPLYYGAALMEASHSQLLGAERIGGALFLAILLGVPLGTWGWLHGQQARPPLLDALLFPNARTLALAWATAIVASGGSYFFVTKWIKDWPFALTIVVFLFLFVLPLAAAVLVTLRSVGVGKR